MKQHHRSLVIYHFNQEVLCNARLGSQFWLVYCIVIGILGVLGGCPICPCLDGAGPEPGRSAADDVGLAEHCRRRYRVGGWLGAVGDEALGLAPGYRHAVVRLFFDILKLLEPNLMLAGALGIVISAVIIWYLLRPDVKKPSGGLTGAAPIWRIDISAPKWGYECAWPDHLASDRSWACTRCRLRTGATDGTRAGVL